MLKFKDRFMFWPASQVTDPWKPSTFRGLDEWDNQSVGIGIPFVGTLIFFWERNFNRDGDEHLCGWGPEGAVGTYRPNCKVCNEILAEFKDCGEES